ncbi:hypothetical protein Desdi_2017 [Desulfitobacterium dichloroeliminans LMG P-21439]|uniref:Uncharacterized protein n=1 Tax=Desulfitobacterium dichloroeliminans (strain LMG P-21439 / DCA1) TaxID=871963 RepID=L0F8E1_DESDL|nr:hypothetical protein [Desulfitobacterium dichloroeliminans]AGA69462.1 hypothetical protein Desdi_2017 [Desulfitobacterium dichloroeliminans LMG P-21439]
MSDVIGIPNPPPGTCLPWEKITEDYGPPVGDEALLKGQWEELDALAYLYLWWWVQR